MRKGLALLVLAAGTALPAVKAYEVDVYRNYTATVSGLPQYGVAQYFRMCVDSLTKVSLWVGDTMDTSSFHLDVYDSVTSERIAHRYAVRASQRWAWLDFAVTADAPPIKGRTYKVVFTRSGGAEMAG